MKGGDAAGVSPGELIAAFAAAVDHALANRAAIRPDWRDAFEHVAALDGALAPYRAAMDAFMLATGKGWSEDDEEAVWNAQGMAAHQLAGLLDLSKEAPRVLGERLVAIERDGGVLLQEAPEDGPAAGGGAAGAPAHCCFTAIRFKNIHQRKVRVSARHADGASTGKEFKPNEQHTLSWSARGSPPVPGALGHCIDLELQVRQGNGWGEVLKLRLCCEHDAQGGVTPKRGDKLTLLGDPPPPPPPGGTATRQARLEALEITAVECADPCPETTSGQAGPAAAGVAESGISKLPGPRIERDYWHYGVWTRLRFKPAAGGCRDFCFVQAVKRKASFKGKPSGTYEPRLAMSTRGGGEVFVLDVPQGQQTPCYPHVSAIDGGKEMRDFPGVKNPFGALGLDGNELGALPVGGVLKVEWTFRTWVVCTNPAPPGVLGRFDWAFTVEITIGKDAAATTVTFTPDPLAQPGWSDDKDLDTYRRIAREAPNNAGFLPP